MCVRYSYLFAFTRSNGERNGGLAHFRFPLVEQIAQCFHLLAVQCRYVLLFRDVIVQVVECRDEYDR
jgi:hypothetical protein